MFPRSSLELLLPLPASNQINKTGQVRIWIRKRFSPDKDRLSNRTPVGECALLFRQKSQTSSFQFLDVVKTDCCDSHANLPLLPFTINNVFLDDLQI